MKTARLTILMTPEQKAEIEARAKAEGLSAGELLRRAAVSYRADEDEVILGALADELERTLKEARQSLKEALSEVKKTLDQASSRRQKAAA